MRCKLLHSRVCVWSVATLLYGAAAAIASQPVPGFETQRGFPHVALLLPTNSAALARSAEAVKDGFVTAARTHGGAQLPIRLYPVSDEAHTAVSAYREAVASGARLVVGPLTRSAVTALAQHSAFTVPTVALNVPDHAGALPPNLHTFGLQTEAEARQVARIAARDGRTRAVTLVGDTPLLHRVQQAFVEEFARTGGRIVADHSFSSNPERLIRMREAVAAAGADMAFLAVDSQRARVLRPYLGTLALYATSRVHDGSTDRVANLELSGVHFIDMPWVLQPDHPAVMIYQHRELNADLDGERLFALGIDAYRIAQGLLTGKREPLDGVTGRLRVGSGRHYVRELIRARFADGKLVVDGDSP
jgi:outer membrane PBP1 activator LpoA protein